MLGNRRLTPSLGRPLWYAWLPVTVLLMCAEFTATAAASNPVFSFGETLVPGNSVWCLATSDLDGDGHPELIGGEVPGNRIVIWEPDGSGRLRVSRTFACPSPRKIVVADFNKDGNKDIVVLVCPRPSQEPGVGRVLRFMGLGGGSFLPPDTLLDESPLDVAVGDINGDGRPDLVIGAQDSISVLTNHGADNDHRISYPLEDALFGMVVGDVTRDGLDDLVGLFGNHETYKSELRVYPGMADGSLGPPSTSPCSGFDGTPLLQDLDGDGGPDLIAPAFEGGFDVYWNNGAGSFEAPLRVPGGDEPLTSLAVADLDGDGRPDLLGVPKYGGADNVRIAWNSSPRGLEPACVFSGQEDVSIGVAAVVAYDFDLDGRLDIVEMHGAWPEEQGGSLIGFRHRLARGFTALAELDYPASVLGAWVISMPDGRSAILAQYSDSMRVMVARADGSFEPAVAYAAAEAAQAIDWNSDGFRDLSIPRGDSIEIQLAGGGREFAPRLPSGELLGHGDFDGDGFEDLLLGPSGPGMLIAFRDPLRGYRPPVPLPIDVGCPPAGSVVAAGDFDGDGFCDLAASVRGSVDSLIVFNNRGGRLVRGCALEVPGGDSWWGVPNPQQIFAIDVDRDLRLDLVFFADVSGPTGIVWVARGAGNGKFAWMPDEYQLPMEAPMCAISDLTNDGLPDLVGLSRWTGIGLGRFSFRANQGQAQFEEPELRHTIGVYPQIPTIGDVDRDGRMDLVFSSNGYYPYSMGIVRVLFNSGSDLATPVALSPLRAIMLGAQARIEWFSKDHALLSGTVVRSDDGGGWHTVGTAWSDGGGVIAFTDASVSSGSRYSYRLDYVAEGVAQHTATIELYVPAAPLGLALAGGNPGHGRLQVSCTLPGSASAKLELFDISGRRVESKVIARHSTRDATVEFSRDSRLAGGVYWIRLAQGSRSVASRIVLLP